MEEVRRLCRAEEVTAALELCRRVFDEFVGPDYSRQGRDTFYRVTGPEENITGWQAGEYVFYGAFKGDALTGAAASRSRGSHIMLLFVDKAYHRRGIARALVEALIEDMPGNTLTVNASPYAEKAYERMGFVPIGDKAAADGMTFIPMEYRK